MDSQQIENVLKRDKFTRPYFRGVFPRDFFFHQTVRPGPQFFVVNTAVHSRPGTHWIALYFEGRHCIFYDPLGLKPDLYVDLFYFIRKNSVSYTYNDKLLQSVTGEACGKYVLHFCLAKGRGKSLCQIVSLFKKNNGLYNDHVVNLWLKRHI